MVAQTACEIPETLGVLLETSIDPTNLFASCASLKDVSYFKDEILFSMHTVFRIGEIQQLDPNLLLYQVNLTLTSDENEHLRQITAFIRAETSHKSSWARLVALLVKIGEFYKSEQLINTVLQQTPDESTRVDLYQLLGEVKRNQGKYQEAASMFENFLEIEEHTHRPHYRSLVAAYIVALFSSTQHRSSLLEDTRENFALRSLRSEKSLPQHYRSLSKHE
jgi:tetratricopeptide (TPR) repeat protein